MSRYIKKHYKSISKRPGIVRERVRRIALVGFSVFLLVALASIILIALGVWVPGLAWR